VCVCVCAGKGWNGSDAVCVWNIYPLGSCRPKCQSVKSCRRLLTAVLLLCSLTVVVHAVNCVSERVIVCSNSSQRGIFIRVSFVNYKKLFNSTLKYRELLISRASNSSTRLYNLVSRKYPEFSFNWELASQVDRQVNSSGS
jgi:hypothetical protein